MAQASEHYTNLLNLIRELDTLNIGTERLQVLGQDAFVTTVTTDATTLIAWADGWDEHRFVSEVNGAPAAPTTTGELFDRYKEGEQFVAALGEPMVLVNHRDGALRSRPNGPTAYGGQLRFEFPDGTGISIPRHNNADYFLREWTHLTYGNPCGCPLNHKDNL